MQYSSIAALSGLLTAGSEKSRCILQKLIHFTQTTIFFFQRLDLLFQLLIFFGNAQCFFRAAFADPSFLANLTACTLYSSSYSLFFDIFVSSVFPFFLFYSLVACVSSFIIQDHKQLERVTEKWEKDDPNTMKSWYKNWDVISPIFKFSADVRKVIYTTNAMRALIV